MKVASDGSSSNCFDWTSLTFFTNPSSVIITTWAEGNIALTTSTSITPTIANVSLEECQACIIADFDFSITDNLVTFNNLSEQAVSYSWDFGDLNTSSDENPFNKYSTYGTFDVCLVVYDNCSSDTICQSIDVIDYTGISELKNSSVFVYPNPANASITIGGLDELTGVGSIFIEDVSGKLIVSLDVNSKEINLSFYTNGLYFLKVTHERGIEVVKFLKS
jgi:PKD repeat protein